ncbi:unnamed protein product [Didymodactylos carnosus]|uniref:HRDC domain-containing protein n=1 Tax=Didymodactylos carnosus TaxID=1234261 RepID=A0A816B2N8_9BILA|nr:unnamed protein product [Didymodactylos carnosus]CAF4484513.1 unnamed protein product [Didymodactylos carnosus]
MFDTFHAAEALNLTSLSLAYLLKEYCHIVANKQYQLADWRIRYIRYAREDTHYLLYISDILRNKLLDMKPKLLQQVYEKSKNVCQYYKQPVFDPNGYQTIYRGKTFNGRQVATLKFLYYWRDRIAREEDESTGYTLPNNTLLQIAEILPTDIAATLFYYNRLPELVQEKLHGINEIILQWINDPSDNNLPVIPSYEPKKLTNARSIAVQRRPSTPVSLGLIDSQRGLSPDLTGIAAPVTLGLIDSQRGLSPDLAGIAAPVTLGLIDSQRDLSPDMTGTHWSSGNLSEKSLLAEKQSSKSEINKKRPHSPPCHSEQQEPGKKKHYSVNKKKKRNRRSQANLKKRKQQAAEGGVS